jgi:SAM-dependent methyltransferase
VGSRTAASAWPTSTGSYDSGVRDSDHGPQRVSFSGRCALRGRVPSAGRVRDYGARRHPRGRDGHTRRERNRADAAALDAFADRMIGVLNDGCTAPMTSIGHQTGLFDTLATSGPATSAQVAEAGGLNERYVREWLNAMTTARFVRYDPESRTHTLLREHAAWLVDDAGPDNMARAMTYLPMFAEVEQGLVQCFREGGGLSYADYPRFHALQAENNMAVVDATLLQQTVPVVEGLDARLRAGVEVADIGCGSGHAINALARAYPASRFTGFDFLEEAVAAGRAEAKAWGLTNATFELCDVATLDRPDAFDVITAFDTIHDQAHPARVLATIARALRPSGTFLMVDIRAASAVEDNLDLPWAPFLYTVSTMHCRPYLGPSQVHDVPRSASAAMVSERCGASRSRRGCCTRRGSPMSRSTRSRAMRSTTTTLRAEWLSDDESNVLAHRCLSAWAAALAGGRG